MKKKLQVTKFEDFEKDLIFLFEEVDSKDDLPFGAQLALEEEVRKLIRFIHVLMKREADDRKNFINPFGVLAKELEDLLKSDLPLLAADVKGRLKKYKTY